MSVYTPVEQSELRAWLGDYELGELRDHRGINAGLTNTNYFVTTERGEYVLTLFEEMSADELPWYLELMAWLADHQIPTARPMPNRAGHFAGELNGRPAALVEKLQGSDIEIPSAAQCDAIGSTLARMHLAGSGFDQPRPNSRDAEWSARCIEALEDKLPGDDLQLLKDQLATRQQLAGMDLPRGVIHGDLFRDNALFMEDKLTGLIDFYYACQDFFLYDLAIVINDWASLSDGSLDAERTRRILQSYHEQRPLTENEHKAWPAMLGCGAFRFYLSRLYDQHHPREGELTLTKDPEEFGSILRKHIASGDALRDLWV